MHSGRHQCTQCATDRKHRKSYNLATFTSSNDLRVVKLFILRGLYMVYYELTLCGAFTTKYCHWASFWHFMSSLWIITSIRNVTIQNCYVFFTTCLRHVVTDNWLGLASVRDAKYILPNNIYILQMPMYHHSTSIETTYGMYAKQFTNYASFDTFCFQSIPLLMLFKAVWKLYTIYNTHF